MAKLLFYTTRYGNPRSVRMLELGAKLGLISVAIMDEPQKLEFEDVEYVAVFDSPRGNLFTWATQSAQNKPSWSDQAKHLLRIAPKCWGPEWAEVCAREIRNGPRPAPARPRPDFKRPYFA